MRQCTIGFNQASGKNAGPRATFFVGGILVSHREISRFGGGRQAAELEVAPGAVDSGIVALV